MSGQGERWTIREVQYKADRWDTHWSTKYHICDLTIPVAQVNERATAEQIVAALAATDAGAAPAIRRGRPLPYPLEDDAGAAGDAVAEVERLKAEVAQLTTQRDACYFALDGLQPERIAMYDTITQMRRRLIEMEAALATAEGATEGDGG